MYFSDDRCVTGRGKCVDEQALLSALRSGQVKAAALDVTAQEPVEDGWKGMPYDACGMNRPF